VPSAERAIAANKSKAKHRIVHGRVTVEKINARVGLSLPAAAGAASSKSKDKKILFSVFKVIYTEGGGAVIVVVFKEQRACVRT